MQEFELKKKPISDRKASELKILLERLQKLKDESIVEISKGDYSITDPKMRDEFLELMGKLLHVLTVTKSDLWEEFHRKIDHASRQRDIPSEDEKGEDRSVKRNNI